MLVHGWGSLALVKGRFYLHGMKADLASMPGKTLLFTGENAEGVHFIPAVIARLCWLFCRCFIPIAKYREIAFYRSMGWVFNMPWRMRAASVSPGRDGGVYARPAFSQYVKNLPGANNHAILTNKTTSVRAENMISLPLFFYSHFDEMERFLEVRQKRLYEDKTKFCAFSVSRAARSSMLANARGWFCLELGRYKPVDCYGAILNNAAIPLSLLERHCENKAALSHLTEEDTAKACRNKHHPDCGYVDRDALNQELFRDYKFVLCFENSSAPDYITEKLPNAMLANSIPIYHGAPNVGEYFNTKSFINCADYPNYEAVIERIIELDQDDEQYRQILRAPFFVNNQLPKAVLNKRRDVKRFLDTLFVQAGRQGE